MYLIGFDSGLSVSRGEEEMASALTLSLIIHYGQFRHHFSALRCLMLDGGVQTRLRVRSGDPAPFSPPAVWLAALRFNESQRGEFCFSPSEFANAIW